MRVRSLGQEDPLEEEMATHSSILTWKNSIDREESVLLQFMEPRRVGHGWAYTLYQWLKFNSKQNNKLKERVTLLAIRYLGISIKYSKVKDCLISFLSYLPYSVLCLWRFFASRDLLYHLMPLGLCNCCFWLFCVVGVYLFPKVQLNISSFIKNYFSNQFGSAGSSLCFMGFL